jgi:mono/diheme cytochrome c family protein
MAVSVAKFSSADAAQPVLTISSREVELQFTAEELRARPDNVVLRVQGDIYHGAVAYRAVPLLALLGAMAHDGFDTVEARARDGFVSQLPLALITGGASGGAVAWVAVEDPAHPWPALPGKTESAGPFSLVWEYPERSHVSREQWPFELLHLTFAASPVQRWPQLALPDTVPVYSAARRGQEVFLIQCLGCHRLRGGGAATLGPDLGSPMSPTQYLSEAGLRAIIRDPRSVRTWPEQYMPGFNASLLPDTDLEAVIAYLRVMAGKINAGVAK